MVAVGNHRPVGLHSADITLVPVSPDTNFTLPQLSALLHVSLDLFGGFTYNPDNSLRFTLNPSDSTAGLSSQDIIGLLNGSSSATVARLPRMCLQMTIVSSVLVGTDSASWLSTSCVSVAWDLGTGLLCLLCST